MTLRTLTTSLFFAVLLLFACGLLWFAAAPTRLGGSVDYVVVHGSALEPKLHDGDLAVLLPRDGAGVATGPHLAGHVWFSIPGGGRAVSWSTDQAVPIAGVAIFLLLLGGGVVSARRWRAWTRFAARAERAFLRPSAFAAAGCGLLVIDDAYEPSNPVVELKVAIVGFLVSSLMVIVALGAGAVARAPDEVTRIRRRYRHRIVSVVVAPNGVLVDARTFEDLIGIAATTECMIRQITQSGVTTFYVDDNGTIYRYRVGQRPFVAFREPQSAPVSVG
jgi:hypothetical protein